MIFFNCQFKYKIVYYKLNRKKSEIMTTENGDVY